MSDGVRLWLAPFLDAGSRTFLPSILLAGVVGTVFLVASGRSARAAVTEVLGLPAWRHRSSRVDLQLLVVRRALVVLGSGVTKLGLAWLLATGLVRQLDRLVGVPALPPLPPVVLTGIASVVLFVAWDLSRYVLHRALHEIGPLWEIHQVHHSAEVLTPLTFHRIHPVEGVLYAVRGALVSGVVGGILFWLSRGAATQWTFLGVAGLGLVLDAALGNLRHSHVWFGWRPGIERWIVSPAQHQMHHALDVQRCNYGTWLAVWDRWGGSWVPSGDTPPAAFGLSPGVRNHRPDDLVSVLWGPVRGAARSAFRGVRLLLVLLGGSARADAQEVAPPDPEVDEEIVVVDEGGVPRVAGSAHVITEEELERYELDDIHQVLAGVPGVYVRVEDGYGLRPNIGIRGANSDRSAKIALLEDGLPIAPAPYAAPAAYYFPLVTRMAGVEVFKGPAALQHGPQTVGGAVNLLTRRAPDEPDGALDLAFGLHTTTKAHGWGGTGGDTWGVLAEVAHLSTEGFKELPGGGPTGFSRQDARIEARLGSAPGAEVRHTVELDVGYGQERSNETYLGTTLDDLEADPLQRYAASQDDRMHWRHTEASLAWKITSPHVQLRTTVWHHYLDRTWSKLNGFEGGPDLHDLLQNPSGGQSEVYVAILRGEADSTSPDQVLQIGTNDRQFHSGGLQSIVEIDSGGPRVRNGIEAGLRVMGDDVVRVHTGSPYDMRSGDLVATGGEDTVLLDSHTRAVALAGYVRDDLDLGRFQILPGARVEMIRTWAAATGDTLVDPDDQAVLLPGLGLFGEAGPWLDLFGGIHRGFSPVAPGQDPETLPETATNLEAGARATPGESHVELIGYLSELQNVTGQCTLSAGCSEGQLDQQFNGGAAEVYGLEALARHLVHLPARVDLTLGLTYTWSHARFLTSFDSDFPQFGNVQAGDVMPYVPEHQGSAELVFAHPRGSVGVTAAARSAMWDVAGHGAIPEDTSVPGQLLVDVAGHLVITKQSEIYATVTNATNTGVLTSWRPYGARSVAPIQVNVGIKVAAR